MAATLRPRRIGAGSLALYSLLARALPPPMRCPVSPCLPERALGCVDARSCRVRSLFLSPMPWDSLKFDRFGGAVDRHFYSPSATNTDSRGSVIFPQDWSLPRNRFMESRDSF